MFPYTISNKGATVFINGSPKMFSNTHPSYDGIIDAIENDDEAELVRLVNVKAQVFKMSLGRVQILDNIVLVEGRQVSGKLIDRILEMVSRGNKAVTGYVRFLDNLMLNPSKKAIDELYLFIEACNLPITPEGMFLAYKRVQGDYMSITTGKDGLKVDNHIGTSPSMPRNEVDDNRDNLCSEGLHFCSYDYLPHYGAWSGTKVVVVSINPANVVSIPKDYNNAKGRACTYDVVGEITDWEGDRITPWFTDEYSPESDDDMEFMEEVDDDDEIDFDTNPQQCQCHVCATSRMPEDDTDTSTTDYDVMSMLEDDEDAGEVRATDHLASTGNRKLSPDDVIAIRKDLIDYHAGLTTLTAIGHKFGVHRENIARIDRGDIWSWVK